MYFFFFKHTTAYELRISYLISDVCSSDLLQACDTYRHQHDESLPIPISVLHLTGDASVSLEDLKAWKAVSRFPVSLTPCDAGHFPWAGQPDAMVRTLLRSEEHTSELQSLMRISYAVFCFQKKIKH